MTAAIEVFSPKITDVGRTAAIALNGSGLRVKITHVSLGSGRSDTDATGAAATDLIARVETVTIAGGFAGSDSFRVSVLFGPAVTPYTATEVGFWAGDPAAGGTLFAIWSTTDPLRVVSMRHRQQYIAAFGMALSGIPSGSIEVTVDPGAAVALALIGAHEGATDPHPQYATKAALQVQKHTAAGTAGTGAAFTLAVAPPVETLKEFTRVHCRFHAAATADMPTLNVCGTGARGLMCYSQTGAKVPVPAGAIAAGMLADVVFDGQDWILLSRLPTSTTPNVNTSGASSSPAFGGGTGTEADPYIIAPSVGAPGALNVKLATITIPGLLAGGYMPVADLHEADNGGRYAATNHVVNGSGALVFDLKYSDSPASAIGATRDLLLKVGNLYLKHVRTITNATVTLAPTITAPGNGTTTSGITPSFTTSAYATSGGADTHKATDWEVATTADFGPSIIFTSTGDQANLTAWTIPAALAYNTPYYVRARHIGTTSGASASSPTVTFTTPVQVTTVRPSITTPAGAAVDVSLTPTITSGPLQVSSGPATHQASSWSLATDAGFVNIVAGTNDNGTSLTSWVPGVALSNDTAYYVRVKHISVTGGASGWSDAVSFRTLAAAAITRPTITAPASGAAGFAGALTSSVFAVTGGSDAHAGSSWQVATDAGFTAIVASGSGAGVKTTWTPTGLQPGTVYFAHVLHQGLSLPASAWSPTVTFTAMAVTKPADPAITGGGAAVLPGAAITTGAFVATGSDPHHDTDWELSTSPTFTPLAGASSLADTVNLTAWAIPAGLTPSTTYYLRARFRSVSGVVSPYSTAVSFTTSATATANTPTLTGPASGTLAANPPTLTTDAFGVSTGSDTHQMTTWQIARDAAFTDIAASSVGDTANLTSWTPSVALAAGGTFYLRTRHKATAAGWSAYSATVTVQTAAAPQTAVTSILTPTADQLGFAGEVTTAPFAITSGTGVHSSTDWQIAADDTFAVNVYASMNDAVNKTSLPTAAIAELVPGTFYYVRARHRDATLGASAQYSPAVRFRRMKTAKPTITSPAAGATGVSTTENVVTSAFASDGADTHLSTDMLVATDAGFTTIVQTVTGRTTSPTIIALAGLANNKAHYTKIRHVGVNGGAGDWSDVTSFQTSKKLGESFASISGIAGTIGTRVSGGKLSIVSRGTTGYVSGDNGASWAANPLPSSNTSDVVYALDKVLGSYVMCRSGVKVSQDGVTFPFDAISPPGQLNAIASDGVVAVAVGNFNVYTSQDLISWTIRASVTSSKTIKGVAYSSELDLFVAVGTSGTVLTSKDGITWVARAAPTTYYFQCIVAAFGKFFASVSNGSVNSIFSTSDGVSWTETHSLPSAVYNQSLVFDGDRILCAPSGIAKLFESFDGVSFIQVSSLPAAGTWIFADKSVVLVNTSSGLLVSSA